MVEKVVSDPDVAELGERLMVALNECDAALDYVEHLKRERDELALLDLERVQHRETLRILSHSRAIDDADVRTILREREPWLFEEQGK